MLEYVFKKIADMPATSLKRGPSTGFPVKFVKFLKETIIYRTPPVDAFSLEAISLI